MSKREFVRGYRIVFALMTIFAMTYQFIRARGDNEDYRELNFFSFFTIESNIFAAVVFLVAALTFLGDRPTRTFDLIRGAAVAYMALVGVTYGILLSGYQVELQTTIPWVDTIVHKILPIVLVADWLIDPPKNRISFKQAMIWVTYPIVYLAYTLIRGPRVDWWPYPFLNPHHESQGYGVVALYSVGIALGFIAFIWVASFLSRRAPEEAIAA